jgi:hypothetical protein
MAKKNSFLEALENTNFDKIDMKGVQLGGDYSSLGKETPISPKIEPKTQFSQNSRETNDLPKKSLKVEEKGQKPYVSEDKPKQVRLKSKIINQKPIVKAQNQDSKLDISLEFLNGMTYDLKVEYLALNGWSLHLERYKGIYFEVAQKYMNRRKYRVYLKELVGMPNYDDYTRTDVLKVQNMTSLIEKKIYLFRLGWSVKVLTRGFQEYEYAVRYFNRKKKHIYLGAYEPNETKIFLK